MIHLYPIGGLGNMMFQIAALHAFAKDNSTQLSLLKIDQRINELLNDKRWAVPHANDLRMFFSKFHQSQSAAKYLACDWGYNKLIFQDETQYEGYFQSEKYFKHHRSEILDIFKIDDTLKQELDNKYQHLYDRCVIHVRRGDYLHQPNNHPVMGVEYYNKAFEMMGDVKYVLFTQDTEWCHQNFQNIEYETVCEKDYCEIYLMSRMQNFIICNSTFSWWGAFLGEKENSKIIAPKIWFGPNLSHLDDKDIVPERWIKI